jgi:hypothetical protein
MMGSFGTFFEGENIDILPTGNLNILLQVFQQRLFDIVYFLIDRWQELGEECVSANSLQ